MADWGDARLIGVNKVSMTKVLLPVSQFFFHFKVYVVLTFLCVYCTGKVCVHALQSLLFFNDYMTYREFSRIENRVFWPG